MIRVLLEHAALLTIAMATVLPMQHTVPFSLTVAPLANVITCQKMDALVVNSSPLLIQTICIMEVLRAGVRMMQTIPLVLVRRIMPRRSTTLRHILQPFTTLQLKLRLRPVQRTHPHYLNHLLHQQLLHQPVLQQPRHQLFVHWPMWVNPVGMVEIVAQGPARVANHQDVHAFQLHLLHLLLKEQLPLHPVLQRPRVFRVEVTSLRAALTLTVAR